MSSSHELSTAQPTFQCQVKFNGQLGTLSVYSNNRLEYSDNSSLIKIDSFDIKSHLVNNNTTDKIMLKIVLNPGAGTSDSVVFIFPQFSSTGSGSGGGLENREKVKNYITEMLLNSRKSSSTVTPMPSSPANATEGTTTAKAPIFLTPLDIQIRSTLISTNKELQNIHRQLVMSGLIEEEEFWTTRQHLLKAQELQLQQAKGIPSAFLADVRPSTSSQSSSSSSSSDVKYTLTPAIIKSIFAQYPQIEQCYKENVVSSGNMTEKDFWTLYFQSKFFLRDKQIVNPQYTSSKNVNIFDKLDMNESPLDVFPISPLINITNSIEDHFSDYGNENINDINSKSNYLSILRRFNKHSEIVLKSNSRRAETGVKTENLADTLVIEDLAAGSNQNTKIVGNNNLLNISTEKFIPFIEDNNNTNDETVSMDIQPVTLNLKNIKLNLSSAITKISPTNYEEMYKNLDNNSSSNATGNFDWPFKEIPYPVISSFLVALKEILSQYWFVKLNNSSNTNNLNRLKGMLQNLQDKFNGSEILGRLSRESDKDHLKKCLKHSGLQALENILSNSNS